MIWLQSLFDQGWALDLVLVVFAVEALVLLWCARQIPRLSPALRGWPTWAAGLGLLLAWRLSSAQADIAWVVLCLMAAGLCHAIDVWQRVRGQPVATGAAD